MSNEKSNKKAVATGDCASDRKAMRHLSHEVVVLAGTIEELCAETIPAGALRVAEVEGRIESVNDAIATIASQADDLRSTIETVVAAEPQRQADLESYARRIWSLAEAIDDIRLKIVPGGTKRVSAIEDRLEAMTGATTALESETGALRGAMDDVRMKVIPTGMNRIGTLEGRAESTDGAIAAIAAEADALRSTVDAVAAAGAARQDALDSYADRIGSLAAAIDDVRTQVIPEGAQRVGTLEGRAESTDGAIAAIAAEADALRSTVDAVAAAGAARQDALDSYVDRIGSLAAAIDDVRTQVIPEGARRVGEIENVVSGLSTSIEEARAGSDSLRSAMDTLTLAHAAHAAALSEHEEKVGVMGGALEVLRSETGVLGQSVASISALQATHVSDLADQSERIESIAGTMEKLCTQTLPSEAKRLIDVEEHLEALAGTVEATRTELREVNAIALTLRPMVETVTATNATQSEQFTHHTALLESLVARLDGVAAAIDRVDGLAERVQALEARAADSRPSVPDTPSRGSRATSPDSSSERPVAVPHSPTDTDADVDEALSACLAAYGYGTEDATAPSEASGDAGRRNLADVLAAGLEERRGLSEGPSPVYSLFADGSEAPTEPVKSRMRRGWRQQATEESR